MAIQPAISERLRPQPMQMPLSGSTTHSFTHGVSMSGASGAFMALV
jgi:hypothetical protein